MNEVEIQNMQMRLFLSQCINGQKHCGGLAPIPADTGQGEGGTSWTNVQFVTNTLTDNLECPVYWTHMTLDVGEKPQHPEGTRNARMAVTAADSGG